MVQGNFKPRQGTGCPPDSSNGSETQTIEPEVMPSGSGSFHRSSLPVALGANGTVDCRIFYFLLGALAAGGFVMYCNYRRNGR